MILPFRSKWPKIHETAFVAGSADIIGDVEIGGDSSVWYQCVIRGDVNSIRIGARTNIQDHSMLHVTRRVSPLKIGDDVTVGHRVTLHGCTVGNRVLLGMGAIVLDDAQIGDDSIVAAGALVTKGKVFPPGSLLMGSPARVVRELTQEERSFLLQSAKNYVGDKQEYLSVVPTARKPRSSEGVGFSLSDRPDFRDHTFRTDQDDSRLVAELDPEFDTELDGEINAEYDSDFSSGIRGMAGVPELSEQGEDQPARQPDRRTNEKTERTPRSVRAKKNTPSGKKKEGSR